MLSFVFCLFGVVVSGLSIVSRETRDGDGDGILDGIVLVFDGSIAAVVDKIADAASNGDFKVQGYSNSRSFVQQSSTKGYIVTSAIKLGASFLEPDSGATPAVRYVASSKAPVPGLATEVGWTNAVDKAAPVLTEAAYASGGSTLALKFSEPVSSVNFGSFVIDACRAANAVTAVLDAADGETVWKVTVNANLDSLDFGCTTISASSSVASFVDAASNTGVGTATLTDFSDSGVPLTIAAAFVDQDQNGRIDALRINTVAALSQKEAWADYSLVQSSPTLESLLRITPNVFNLAGYTGLGQSAVVVDDWYYYFNFTEQPALSTGTTGTVYFSSLPTNPVYNWAGPNTGGLYGLAGTSAGLPNGIANAKTVADAAAPLILEAFTRDTNHDGYIDQIEVTFTEAMGGGDTGIENWLVSDPDLVSASTTAYCDGNKIVIGSLSPPNPSVPVNLGTAVTPTIFYSGQDAVDPAGNVLVALKAPLRCKDGAGPVIVTAEGWASTPFVRLTFSETVFPDPAFGLVWSAQGFFTVSEAMSNPNEPMLVISSVVSNETSVGPAMLSTVLVTLSRDLTDNDFGGVSGPAPMRFLALATVVDASGNAADVTAGATLLSRSDNPVPNTNTNHNHAFTTASSVASLIYAMTAAYACVLFTTF